MISKKDIYKEIISPKELLKQEDPRVGYLLYKICYMILRITIDCRSNIMKMATGEKLEYKERK